MTALIDVAGEAIPWLFLLAAVAIGCRAKRDATRDLPGNFEDQWPSDIYSFRPTPMTPEVEAFVRRVVEDPS